MCVECGQHTNPESTRVAKETIRAVVTVRVFMILPPPLFLTCPPLPFPPFSSFCSLPHTLHQTKIFFSHRPKTILSPHTLKLTLSQGRYQKRLRPTVELFCDRAETVRHSFHFVKKVCTFLLQASYFFLHIYFKLRMCAYLPPNFICVLHSCIGTGYGACGIRRSDRP